jgi:peptide chain release factor 1
VIPIEKLEALKRRFSEIDQLLCDPAVSCDRDKLMHLNKERSDIEPVVGAFGDYQSLEISIADAKEALADPELRELAQDEISEHEAALEKVDAQLQMLLLPKDPNDERNTILEIRAGTGGEEAALFAADLFRMFSRYAESKHWTVEVLSSSAASAGGYKEVIALVSGKHVYSHLRFEAGVHRVQRVPATEAQGRIHTSTATVAVLPEADEVDVKIDDADLDISIAASGGPGGQGVNTTNSAVQLRHIPSGLIVKCQDERSQHKNKARAMKVLRSRLLEREQKRVHAELTAERRGMVGSGERSEKIRTYNFPQNRVTDHRIQLTLHKLEPILQGDIGELIGALRTHRQAELLRQETKP